MKRQHVIGRARERALGIVHDRERRRAGAAGSGDRLDDVRRAPGLRDADHERASEPRRRPVKGDEGRRRERDGKARDEPERVLRVAGRVVRRAARRDEDERNVRAAPARRERRRVPAFLREKARDGLRLLEDLAVQNGTRAVFGHRAMLA